MTLEGGTPVFTTALEPVARVTFSNTSLTEILRAFFFWRGVAYHSVADYFGNISTARKLKAAKELGVTRASDPQPLQKKKK